MCNIAHVRQTLRNILFQQLIIFIMLINLNSEVSNSAVLIIKILMIIIITIGNCHCYLSE